MRAVARSMPAEGGMTEPWRIAVLARSTKGVNAINDASACLVEALKDIGCQAEMTEWRSGTWPAGLSERDVVVVPYNPFLYGRWGFAPRLVRDIWRLRRRRPRPSIALVIHEPYVPIRGPKSLVTGAWQRGQLVALLLLADNRFASIQPWAQRLCRFRSTTHLPSGSNLPDARTKRESVRAELGVADRLVVATLSTGHPSHLTAYVAAALRRIVAAGIPTTFLQLGAGAAVVEGVPAQVPVVATGSLSADRLAAHLAAADLLLMPLIDGVSTRRTSFMAGLQNGVAVVATKGPLTDPMLRATGLNLIEVGDPSAFAALVALLARDAQRREAAAAQGRALFEAEFTWEAIARRFLDEVESK